MEIPSKSKLELMYDIVEECSMHLDSLLSEDYAEVIADDLKKSLELIENPKLIEAMHYVIAYHSIPGTYLNGRFDIDPDCGSDFDPDLDDTVEVDNSAWVDEKLILK